MAIVKSQQYITIKNGVNWVINNDVLQEEYHVMNYNDPASETLTSNWTITETYAPGPVNRIGTHCKFRVKTNLVLGGNHVYILGTMIPDALATKQYIVDAFINPTGTWEIRIIPDFEDTSIVTTSNIEDLAVTTIKIAAKAVTLAKMDDLAYGSIYIGDATNRPVALTIGATTQILISNGTTLVYRTISNDATITNTGVLTIANGVVTNAKMAGLLRGYIKVGDAADLISDLDARANGAILIGDGNDVNSVTITGSITLDSAGLTTLVANAVTTTTITDSNVTEAKLGQTVPGAGVVMSAMAIQRRDTTTTKALLTGASQNLFYMHKGDIIIRAGYLVGTASGVVQTINMGFDANSNPLGGADADGLIVAADSNVPGVYDALDITYSGVNVTSGSMTIANDGYITAISTANLTATAIDIWAYVEYLPA